MGVFTPRGHPRSAFISTTIWLVLSSLISHMWWSLKVHIFAGLDQILTNLTNFWSTWPIFHQHDQVGQFRTSLTNFWPTWPTLLDQVNHFWPTWPTFGQLDQVGQFLTNLTNFWPTWPTFDQVGHFWQTWQTFGQVGHFWPTWPTFHQISSVFICLILFEIVFSQSKICLDFFGNNMWAFCQGNVLLITLETPWKLNAFCQCKRSFQNEICCVSLDPKPMYTWIHCGSSQKCFDDKWVPWQKGYYIHLLCDEPFKN